MEINLTREEYRKLVKLVFLGSFVKSGEGFDRGSTVLMSKIFSKYKDFDCEDLVMWVEKLKMFTLTPKAEDDFLRPFEKM